MVEFQPSKLAERVRFPSRAPIQGYSSVGRVLVSKTMGRGFESFCPCQKIRQVSTCRIFLSKPQAWYIITARSVVHIISPFGAVSHHALAWIYLRLDDIQHFVLVICNSCGIDDIHGFRRDFAFEFETLLQNCKNIFFVAYRQKEKHASACFFFLSGGVALSAHAYSRKRGALNRRAGDKPPPCKTFF